MRHADKPDVVIIYGSNNKVSFGEKPSFLPTIVFITVVAAILAISLCCPDLLDDFVRWIIGKAINS